MKLTHLVSSLVAGAASLLMAAGPAAADNNRYGDRNDYRYGGGGYGGLVLFEHSNFGGQALPVNDNIARLDRFRFNDAASSIQIRGGGVWQVCSDADFRGTCRTIDASVARLDYLGLNDRISSIRRFDASIPRPYPGNGYGRDDRYGDRGWGNRDQRHGYGDRYENNGRYGYGQGALVIYEHGDFGGQYLPVNQDLYDLNRTNFNDKVSSIRVNSGRWLICSDPGFRGRCEVLQGTTRSLHYFRMNDAISSIKRIG